MTPDVDTRRLKERVQSTRPVGDAARALTESLPDSMDPYSFSIQAEALLRLLTSKSE